MLPPIAGIQPPMTSGGGSDYTQRLSAQVSGGGSRPVALRPKKEKCGRGSHQAQRVGGLHGRPAAVWQYREDAVRAAVLPRERLGIRPGIFGGTEVRSEPGHNAAGAVPALA